MYHGETNISETVKYFTNGKNGQNIVSMQNNDNYYIIII